MKSTRYIMLAIEEADAAITVLESALDKKDPQTMVLIQRARAALGRAREELAKVRREALAAIDRL